MKRLLALSTLLICAPAALAQDLSAANPVVRTLTLQQGELAVGGGVYYGETANGDKEWKPSAALAYGLTDNLTIGPVGARYAVVRRPDNQHGLEITLEGGLMGWYETEEGDDSIGVGAGLTGKYVFNDDLAIVFNGAYVYWDEDNRPSRQECRLLLGALWRIQEDVTLFANAEYRELEDFGQDHAYGLSAGATWNLSSQMDLVVSAGYSDFSPLENGYKADSELEKQAGVSLVYRF